MPYVKNTASPDHTKSAARARPLHSADVGRRCTARRTQSRKDGFWMLRSIFLDCCAVTHATFVVHSARPRRLPCPSPASVVTLALSLRPPPVGAVQSAFPPMRCAPLGEAPNLAPCARTAPPKKRKPTTPFPYRYSVYFSSIHLSCELGSTPNTALRLRSTKRSKALAYTEREGPPHRKVRSMVRLNSSTLTQHKHDQ